MPGAPLAKSLSLSPQLQKGVTKLPTRPASFRIQRPTLGDELAPLESVKHLSNSSSDVFGALPTEVKLRHRPSKTSRRPVSCDVGSLNLVAEKHVWDNKLRTLNFSASEDDLQSLQKDMMRTPSAESLSPLLSANEVAHYKKKDLWKGANKRRLVHSAVLLGDHQRKPRTPWGDSFRMSWDLFLKKLLENQPDLRK